MSCILIIFDVDVSLVILDELCIARQKLRQAEAESELLSETEEPRKRKRRRAERFCSSESDSEDQTPRNIIKRYPQPPTVNDLGNVKAYVFNLKTYMAVFIHKCYFNELYFNGMVEFG
jgi:hypothetical protein